MTSEVTKINGNVKESVLCLCVFLLFFSFPQSERIWQLQRLAI